jgi:hypothetical protein
VVVDELEAVLVEDGTHVGLCDGKTNGVGDTWSDCQRKVFQF